MIVSYGKCELEATNLEETNEALSALRQRIQNFKCIFKWIQTNSKGCEWQKDKETTNADTALYPTRTVEKHASA